MSKKDNPDKLAERVAALEVHMDWVRKKLDIIDKRLWWVLGTVVVLGLLSIIISLMT